MCLSCNPGDKYNETINDCQICDLKEYPIIIENFNECRYYSFKNCELYNTICKSFEEDENLCKKSSYNNTCLISNKNYKILL